MHSQHLRPLLIAVLALALVAMSAPMNETGIAVAQTDFADLVAGNNAFAFDLYHAVREESENVIYSPYSLSLALAMVYAGARGETEAQVAETLHFTLPQDDLHPAFDALHQALTRPDEEPGPDEQPLQLNIASAVWGQDGFPFYREYLGLLEANYGAGLTPLDFIGAPEESRQVINAWVSQETEERVQDLLPPGTIDSATRLVLTNAIYFNGAWQFQFEEAATQDSVFHLLDGDQVMVPMMRQSETFGYAAGESYQAVQLPYQGGQAAMLILLPDAGEFETVEEALDADLFSEIVSALTPTHLALSMPRFEYESSFSLADTLADMGMSDAFDPQQADFSGIAPVSPEANLFISAVVHKAFVSVDEAGTEAAAATGVVFGVTSAPMQTVEVRVDRPFIYAIYDLETQTILFVGRVLNPGA